MNVIDHKDTNIHNGLITKIWGPHMWISMHAISFGYPLHPTEEEKKQYKTHFESYQYVLPCKYCRDSYAHFIKSEPTILDDTVFESRETLTKWVFLLHERVNNKLGVTYEVDYSDVVTKYESMRAICVPGIPGCVMPANLKAKSYQTMEKKECPIISLKLANAFKDYAAKRDVSFNKLEHYYKLKQNKKSLEWEERDKKCREIIFNMRNNGIPSVEKEGEFCGLPTVNELQLISMLSTTMSRDELCIITQKLGNPVCVEYKLKI